MVAVRRKCKVLDDLITKNPDKPLIEITQSQMDLSRAFVKNTPMGLFEYDGRYFIVKEKQTC